MTFTTLIDTTTLAAHLDDPNWAVIDCRFSLQDTELGRRAHRSSHIPGALYAHLDVDLSSPIISGQTGRHPLPTVEKMAATLSGWGVDEGVQVVVYDDWGGAIAARLWWMLRWLGHEAVAVLDGGWQAWQQAGQPVHSGDESRPPRTFVPAPRPELIVTIDEVELLRRDPAWRVLDARSADRYRGENETLDPQAGHIPGALSAPYAMNLGSDGLFLAPDALAAHYARLLGGVPAAQAIAHCGSGVTGAHDILAMRHAGLGEAKLFVGSWSLWCSQPDRPVAVGSDPG
jgi:thiosulfate/3-mercaptopyruvate sulfurtransferase